MTDRGLFPLNFRDPPPSIDDPLPLLEGAYRMGSARGLGSPPSGTFRQGRGGTAGEENSLWSYVKFARVPSERTLSEVAGFHRLSVLAGLIGSRPKRFHSLADAKTHS